MLNYYMYYNLIVYIPKIAMHRKLFKDHLTTIEYIVKFLLRCSIPIIFILEKIVCIY